MQLYAKRYRIYFQNSLQTTVYDDMMNVDKSHPLMPREEALQLHAELAEHLYKATKALPRRTTSAPIMTKIF